MRDTIDGITTACQVAVKLAEENRCFGAVMNAISHAWGQWLQKNGWPAGGEFSCGPCVALLVTSQRGLLRY